MEYNLTSGSMKEVLAVPDSLKIQVVSPQKSVKKETQDEKDILDSILNPIASKSIKEQFKRGQNIVIVVDDATRPTPTRKLLTVLLPYLHSLGAEKQNVRLVIGKGLHRKTTAEERLRIFGQEILDSYPIGENNPEIESDYREVGKLSDSTVVSVHKWVAEADLVITLGIIKSHAFAGFTGGAKSILPGVSNKETILHNHRYENIKYPNSLMGSCENVSRKGMEKAARLIDPFIINVVLGMEDNILKIVSGDVVEAHRAGVEFYRTLSERCIDEQVDVTIVNGGHAGTHNFYQAMFGLNVVRGTERPILKKNGTVILFAECREGTGSKITEDLLQKFDCPMAVLKHLEISPTIVEQWAAQFLASFLVEIDILLVSTGMTKELAGRLKVRHFGTAKEALQEALKKHGNQCSLLLIENSDYLILNTKYRE